MKNNTNKFTCTNNLCSAAVYTDINCEKILNACNAHRNHNEYSKEDIDLEIFRNEVKDMAADDNRTGPSNLIKKAVQNTGMHFDYEQLKQMRQSVYKVRKRKYPTLPKSLDEAIQKLIQLQEVTFTENNQRFCYVGARQTIIFTTKDNLQLLCASEEVYGDGTFDKGPKFFTQLYTLHILKNGYYLQLVYCFLPKKDNVTYTNMWLDLIDLCIHLIQTNILIKSFVADFAHISAYSIFGCKIRCCRFHLGQNFYRHIKEDRFLKKEYENEEESEVGIWLSTFFGLSLLPPEDVRDGFDVLIETAPDNNLFLK